MVSFENFVKSMLPSLSELKVTPSFCFPFKIPDDPTATINYICTFYLWPFHRLINYHEMIFVHMLFFAGFSCLSILLKLIINEYRITIYQTQSITRLLESFGYLLTLFFVTKVQILKHKLLILLLFIHWIFKFCNWWDMQWIFVDGSFEIVSFLNKPWATVYILGQ